MKRTTYSTFAAIGTLTTLLTLTIFPANVTHSLRNDWASTAAASSLSRNGPLREPTRTERPTSSFRSYLPHWTTEDGFASILYIRNVQMVNAVRVRLSLILKHRTITLAEREIDAAQTVSVDVSQELIANSERAEQEGGAVIDYTANSAGGVNAWGQVVNETRSLSFSFSFMPDGSRHEGPLDAVAWYFDRDTDAFVSLQNTTNDFVRVNPTPSLNG